MSDEPMPAWAGALMEAISDLRAEMNVRFDRAEKRADEHAKQIEGAIRLGNAADNTAAGADIASLERDLHRARWQAAHGELIGSLQQQVAALQEQVAALREGRAGA